MNGDNYGKWLTDKLIPNVPEKSVLVIDNAPYHNIQVDRAPTFNANKASMIEWLSKRNVVFSPNMLKPQLYNWIKSHKPNHLRYKFVEILNQHGHSILRLPPYHPELNPIEMVWAQVKNRFRQLNTTFKLDDVRKTHRKWIYKGEHWRLEETVRARKENRERKNRVRKTCRCIYRRFNNKFEWRFLWRRQQQRRWWTLNEFVN